MSKSKISKLSRVKMVGVITKRISTIGKASNAPAKDLLDYYPNKLAAELHPKAQNVVVFKRSMNAGYAGVANPLFFRENASMCFGDARATMENILKAL